MKFSSKILLILILVSLTVASIAAEGDPVVNLSKQEWKEKLTPEQFHVCREGGTEPAFTGKYHDFHGEGEFVCSNCGAKLFSGKDKFDSGSGWPSYTRPMSSEAVTEKSDSSHGMQRTEVVCSKCGAHLGHVFNDGPKEAGGLRYCINSVSLDYKETSAAEPKNNSSDITSGKE